MYTQHIILDFEMNPVAKENKSVRQNLHREIVEIGAVKVNEEYEIIDRFSCLIKPQFNTKITSFITNLTGIATVDVADAQSFEEAFGVFQEWIGDERKTRIYSWSDTDLRQLKDECLYKGVSIPESMKRWMDFQAVYPRVMGLPSRFYQMALHTAAEQYGILMDSKAAHRALYDAEITAKIVIPVLNGEYRRQAEILREVICEENEPMTQSLGEAFGGVFSQLLNQLQYEPVLGR